MVRRLILGLGLASCVALGGCGNSSGANPGEMTEAQKAEREARDKATADAFRDYQKNHGKAASGAKPKPRTVNGVRTS